MERLTTEEYIELQLVLEDFIAHLDLMEYMAWEHDTSAPARIIRHTYGEGAL